MRSKNEYTDKSRKRPFSGGAALSNDGRLCLAENRRRGETWKTHHTWAHASLPTALFILPASSFQKNRKANFVDLVDRIVGVGSLSSWPHEQDKAGRGQFAHNLVDQSDAGAGLTALHDARMHTWWFRGQKIPGRPGRRPSFVRGWAGCGDERNGG